MAKDYLENDIQVGDTVVFMLLNYRSFEKGIITYIAPKKLKIEHPHPNIPGHTTHSIQYHNQVIKINNII